MSLKHFSTAVNNPIKEICLIVSIFPPATLLSLRTILFFGNSSRAVYEKFWHWSLNDLPQKFIMLFSLCFKWKIVKMNVRLCQMGKGNRQPALHHVLCLTFAWIPWKMKVGRNKTSPSRMSDLTFLLWMWDVRCFLKNKSLPW